MTAPLGPPITGNWSLCHTRERLRRPWGWDTHTHTCDSLLICALPLNCRHGLMSGLEAQQMSHWRDNYHEALMSVSAARLLRSGAAGSSACLRSNWTRTLVQPEPPDWFSLVQKRDQIAPMLLHQVKLFLFFIPRLHLNTTCGRWRVQHVDDAMKVAVTRTSPLKAAAQE